MPEHDLHPTQANHAEAVLDTMFPADHEPAKMMEPGKKVAPLAGALRGRVRSSRCRGARTGREPDTHDRRLWRRSVVSEGSRRNSVRGRLRRVGFRAGKRFWY